MAGRKLNDNDQSVEYKSKINRKRERERKNRLEKNHKKSLKYIKIIEAFSVKWTQKKNTQRGIIVTHLIVIGFVSWRYEWQANANLKIETNIFWMDPFFSIGEEKKYADNEIVIFINYHSLKIIVCIEIYLYVFEWHRWHFTIHTHSLSLHYKHTSISRNNHWKMYWKFIIRCFITIANNRARWMSIHFFVVDIMPFRVFNKFLCLRENFCIVSRVYHICINCDCL